MIAMKKRHSRPVSAPQATRCGEVQTRCSTKPTCREPTCHEPTPKCGLSAMTDLELMAAYDVSRDGPYFSEFFNRHKDSVAKSIFKQAKAQIDQNDLDDLVQETFIEALVDRGSVNAPADGNLGAWVSAIARNNYLDSVRKGARSKERNVSLATVHFTDCESHLDRSCEGPKEPIDEDQLEPWAESLYGEAVDDLLRVLKSIESLLPEDYDLIDRLFYKNQTHQEIAEALGVTNNCIEHRKYRLLDDLRSYLGDSIQNLDRTLLSNLR